MITPFLPTAAWRTITHADGSTHRVWLGDVSRPQIDEPGYVASASDPDGDGFDDDIDNCDWLFNPDQLDRERLFPAGVPNDLTGDGVGDYTKTCVDSAGAMQTIDCTTGNPDTDGDGILDACDTCRDVANRGDGNCNEDVEQLFGFERLGDACDPSPCPSTEPRMRDITGTGSIRRTVTDGFLDGRGVITDITGRANLVATARTGFPFCVCATDTFGSREEDSIAVRQDCAVDVRLGGPGCAQRAREYDSLEWRRPTLSFTGDAEARSGFEAVVVYRAPPAISGDPSATFAARWSFETDPNSAIAGARRTFGIEPFITTSLRGVWWSRMIAYEGFTSLREPRGVCNVAGSTTACPTTGGNLNSHFWSGELQTSTGLHPPFSGPLRFLGPFLPPRDMCPMCFDAFPTPFLREPLCASGLCSEPETFARFATAELDVKALMSVGVRAQLVDRSARMVFPVEALRDLSPDAVRMVALDNTTSLPRFALVARAGVLDFAGQQQPPPGDQLPPPNAPPGDPIPAPSALAATPGTNVDPVMLSGNRGELYILRSAGGVSYDQLEIRSALTSDVRYAFIGGAISRNVLAYALDPVAPRAFVLDVNLRGRREVVRLLELDLERGSVRTLAEAPRLRVFDAHALAVAPDGTLYLAASNSRARRHLVLRLGTASRGLSLRGATAARGTLAGPIRADYLGVSMPITTAADGTWAMVGYSSSDFTRGPRTDFAGCF